MTQLPDVTIDRSSPVPFYFQLAELLEREITSNRWPNGMRLPGEFELCEHFAISRTTVRQALGRLEQRGLIERRKGQGTFVHRGQSGLWLLQSSGGFFQEETDVLGRVVTSTILRAKRGTLPPWACRALGLPQRSKGATLERLRAVDGLVALYVVNHLIGELADATLAITNPNESLYRRLSEQTGVVPSGGQRTLEAVAAEPWLADLLELEPGAPVAFIESSTWDADMRPFDVYRAWLRTDRTRIEIHATGPETVGLPLAAGEQREEGA